MDDRAQDYLFDLQGYLVLKNAISAADLREMNQWIDDHESYVAESWSTDVYRYSPKYVRERLNYQISEELLQRLTPERRASIEPNAPRRPPSV